MYRMMRLACRMYDDLLRVKQAMPNAVHTAFSRRGWSQHARCNLRSFLAESRVLPFAPRTCVPAFVSAPLIYCGDKWSRHEECTR